MDKSKQQDVIDYSLSFTSSELQSLQEKKIWFSWHPVMKRILSRSPEMASVFIEIANATGVLLSPTCSAFRLIHEAIWNAERSFKPESIAHAKAVAKELSELHIEIPRLAAQLSTALRRQRELVEREGFSREEYLYCVDLLTRASRGNGHYNGWVKEHLDQLDLKYGGKYWPEPENIVAAIGSYEEEQPIPKNLELSDELLKGRASLYKGFVLGLDEDIRDTYQIPSSFQFSNSAMATITNVVLDLPSDSLATEDGVRLIRYRSKKR